MLNVCPQALTSDHLPKLIDMLSPFRKIMICEVLEKECRNIADIIIFLLLVYSLLVQQRPS